MRKKRKLTEIDPGGTNYWETYGIAVTALLCLFIIVFSVSAVDAEKWGALKNAFGGGETEEAAVPELPVLTPETVLGSRPIDLTPFFFNTDAASRASFNRLVESMEVFLEENSIAADISANHDRYILTVRFEDSVFFESGGADITDAARPVLDSIAGVLTQLESYYSMVCIEGHTDDMPISTARYNSNWELSVARAVNTLRYILETGEGSALRHKISATGYGEEHPVDTNETPEGRASNRRVDFVIQAVY